MRERGRGRGERERNNPSSKPLDKHSKKGGSLIQNLFGVFRKLPTWKSSIPALATTTFDLTRRAGGLRQADSGSGRVVGGVACVSADAWRPSCGGRVCRHLHHAEAASPSISTARHDAYKVLPATRMRRMQAPHASLDCRTVRLWAGTRACKWVRTGRMQS